MKKLIFILFLISCNHNVVPVTPYIPSGSDTTIIVQGTPGKDGKTPIKGVDYFDGKTPIKNIDYFDGVPGKDGITTIINTGTSTGSSSVINVKDYGVKGDGKTDDTKALQSVLNMLASDLGTGNFKIIIPKGNYLLGHLETPNSASFFTIEGEGMSVTNLLFIGSDGQDFITFINPQRITLKDLTLIGQTIGGEPSKMINVLRTDTKNGDMGFVSDTHFENIDIPGYRGRFKNGIVFSSTGANGGLSDQNNEQSSIVNCFVELADSIALSFEHQNSLWHNIERGRYSGQVACINNVRSDGTTGGGFSIHNSTVMIISDATIGFNLTGSQYPIHIDNVHSEGGGRILYARNSKDEYPVTFNITMTNGDFKAHSYDYNIDIAGADSKLTLRDCYLLSGSGARIQSVKSDLVIDGGNGNLNSIRYSGNVSISNYKSDALLNAGLINLGGGKLFIADNNTKNLTNNSSQTASDGVIYVDGIKKVEITASSQINDIVGGYEGAEVIIYAGAINVFIGGSSSGIFTPNTSTTNVPYPIPQFSAIKVIKSGAGYGGRWAVVF